MLELKNYRKEYNSKLILAFNDFKAFPYQITVLYGESGCGKTTLLDSISQANPYYKLNNNIIDSQNVVRYVSYAPQIPLFVDSMTMMDNILLFLKLNHKDMNEQRFQYLNDLLDLDYMLKKYPHSLSGGELRRISFAMNILLEKDILLFDEPTASLDEEYRKAIRDIFITLKNEGKIIIVSTHDDDLRLLGDRIYELKNQTLYLKKEQNIQHKDFNERKKEELSYKDLYFLLRKRKKYHPIKNTFLTLLTIVIVLCLGFSMIYGNETIRGLKNWLNNSVSDQMIVFKRINEGTDDYEPFQAPLLENQEYDYLLNHSYIKEVKANHNGMANEQNNKIRMINNNKEFEFNIDELQLNYSTYYKEEDYTSDLVKQYHEDGVYISEELANLLEVSDDNSKIGFYLAIPHHISSPGGYMSYAKDSSKYYHVDLMECVYEYVEMNIAGVYKNNYMGIYVPSVCNGNGRIYVEKDVYESYIEKYKLDKGYEQECFNQNVCKVTHINPYVATSYVVLYDVEHLDDLLINLYDHDFRFVNDYYDSQTLLDVQQKNSTMITSFSVIVFIVGCIVILSMKYVQREDTKQLYNVMSSQGLMKKTYYKIMSLLWIEDTVFIAFVTSVISYGLSMILNSLFMEYTLLNGMSICLMIFISVIVCFVIPFLSDSFALR